RRPVEDGGAPARSEDVDPQPRLHRELVLDAEPAQERAIARATAQGDVLPVVEPVAVALDREGRAAELRPRLEERDRRPRVRAVERSRDPGEAAADHRDPHVAHASAPASVRTMTR